MLIDDTKKMLNSFAVWSVNHVKREANKVAHNLAQNSLLMNENLYDLEEIPIYLLNTINTEMM